MIETIEDKVYLAALLDCEGFIGCRENPQGIPGLIVAVGMCNEPIVKWLYDNFGGYFRQHTPKKENWSVSWAWRVWGAKCQVPLEMALPHSRIKQQQMAYALEFCKTIRGNDRSSLTEEELAIKFILADYINSTNSKRPRYSEEEHLTV